MRGGVRCQNLRTDRDECVRNPSSNANLAARVQWSAAIVAIHVLTISSLKVCQKLNYVPIRIQSADGIRNALHDVRSSTQRAAEAHDCRSGIWVRSFNYLWETSQNCFVRKPSDFKRLPFDYETVQIS